MGRFNRVERPSNDLALNTLKILYVTRQDEKVVEYASNHFKELANPQKLQFFLQFVKWLKGYARSYPPVFAMLQALYSMIEEQKAKIIVPLVTETGNWTINEKPICSSFFCSECAALEQFLKDPNSQVWRFKVENG